MAVQCGVTEADKVTSSEPRTPRPGHTIVSDGTYVDLTVQAITAFQTAEGLPADGVAGCAHLDRLTDASRPSARTQQVDGLRRAPLGNLYRPKYVNAGIAIHGYPSVPAASASHGFARVGHPTMDLLWSAGAGIGTAVWVYE